MDLRSLLVAATALILPGAAGAAPPGYQPERPPILIQQAGWSWADDTAPPPGSRTFTLLGTALVLIGVQRVVERRHSG